MTNWIETERTRLRPFEETDAEEAFTWFSDPEVMKYIPRGGDATIADTRSRIAWYREHEARHGFSKRIIIHRESGGVIGDSGLFHLPDGQRIELGFRLARPYWDAGYASEVGRAWLEWFDRHRPGEDLFADVHEENAPSRRVLQKLQFAPSHSEEIFGMPMLIYRRHRVSPLRFEKYRPEFREAMLGLHRGAIAGFDLGMSAAEDEADLMAIEDFYLRDGGEFLLGFIDGKLVAMGGYKMASSTTAELRRMRIAQECQGQGLGTALLRELEQIALRSGVRTLFLATARRRPLTLSFYRKHGYTETGQSFYGVVETVEFRKELGADPSPQARNGC